MKRQILSMDEEVREWEWFAIGLVIFNTIFILSYEPLVNKILSQ